MLPFTQVEELLSSAVMPIMSIYRLPQGQYGYSGHVINLPQEVLSFATSLPQLPAELLSEKRVLTSLTVTFVSGDLWSPV